MADAPRGTLVAFLCTLWCASALAEAPDVKRFSPPGLQRGTTASIKVEGKLGTAPVSAWCSSPGVSISPGQEEGTLTVIADETAPPGLCWIRLYNAEGASSLRPFIIGLLPEVAEDERNNALDDAQAVESADATVNGVLGRSGDVDTFAVQLREGETLVACLEAQRLLASPMDAVLQVLAPNGAVLAHNDDDHGFDPRITLTAPADGTYYVRTFAFPADPNSTIRYAGGDDYVYRLTLTAGPFVDALVPAAVSADTPSTTAQMAGVNLPADLPPMDLQIADGQVLGHLPYPASWQLPWMPIVHGTVIAEGSDDHSLSVPGAITGCIDEAGQVDEVSFEAKKGNQLRITAAARAIHSLLDPVVSIHDADGKQLEEKDDAGRDNLDSQFDWTAPEDGEYRIRIRDRFGHGGSRCIYVLQVDTITPDFSLSVEKDAYVLKPDAALEISITVARRDGFDGAIEVDAIDVPEGVVVTKATSAGKGDSAKKVTLKLSSERTDAASAPIRIVGRVGEGVTKAATAETMVKPLRTAAIWLTVLPKPADDAAAE